MAVRRGALVVTSGAKPGGGPRVAIGMTLYNNARHLPEAFESLLGQTWTGFTLVALDDGSSDGTEQVARQYAKRDPRVRYHRHAARQGMVATWREAVERAIEACPSAEYFAWASDHDRWHPRWLEALVSELDRARGAVLAYPLTERLRLDGERGDKEPRRFDTAGMTDVAVRWRHFCHHGVGAGDMVYGLMRVEALRAAGIFRPVLRPDRLLVAELVLRGEIRQVPEILWFRRTTGTASVARQRHTLLRPGTEPYWFRWPPWLQHARILRREYPPRTLTALGLTPGQWRWMRLRYQAAYAWRHARKSETSYLLGRGLDGVIHAGKLARHYYHHAVYRVLVTVHAWRNRAG